MASTALIDSAIARQDEAEAPEPEVSGDPTEEEQEEREEPATRALWPSLSIVARDLETDFPTKTARELILSPSTISVVKETSVQWSGARHPSDLLRLVPGMNVMRINSAWSNVSVRGFNDSPTASQGILASIDGRQVYNEWLGNVLWDQLTLIVDDIEEVEVIRGPGSFLYGPNAMHGLVNFKTRSPLDYAESELSIVDSFGTVESSLHRFRYVKRDQESGAGLIATFAYDSIGEFEEWDDLSTDKIFGELRFEQDLGGGSRNGAEKSDHRLEVGTGISDQTFDILIPTFFPPVPSDQYSNEAQETYATAKYVDGGFVARATWTGFDSSSEAELYAPFDLDLDTTDVDVHYSFELLEDHDLTAGASYRHATYSTEDEDVSEGRNTAELFSGYLQDEVTVVPDELFLTAGVRIDEHSEAGTNVAPRSALVWRFEESHSVRFSYGKGHRNPSLGENWRALTVTLPFGVVTLRGNEELEAEKIDTYELGYRGWFAEDTLRVGVTSYLNYIDDLVEFRAAGPLSVRPENQDEQKAYGVELDLEYSFNDSLSAFTNYSYGIREDRATGDRIHAGPENTANLGFRYSSQPHGPAERTWDAMAWVTYFDDTEVLVAGPVDDYVILSGSLSYNFLRRGKQRGSAFLRAYNLLDDEHLENPEGDELGLILQLGVRFSW